MTVNELHSKIVAAKKFLNDEVVKIRTSQGTSSFNFREVGDRLDMIHEVERIGVRNLNEREQRKIARMIDQLDIKVSPN